MKKIALAFFLANLIAIVASAADGIQKGNIASRFEEKEAITLISSNQLACTALLGWIVFMRKKSVADRNPTPRRRRMENFWLISAAGFLYLTLDESFQFHEGMDTGVLRLFGYVENPRLDGLATGLYGLVAAAVCYYYRREILAHRETLVFFCLGGLFLAATSALNIGDAPKWQIVIEETCKVMGVVSFLLGHLAAFRLSIFAADEPNPHTPGG